MKKRYIALLLVGAFFVCVAAFRYWTQPSISLSAKIVFIEYPNARILPTGEQEKYFDPYIQVTARNNSNRSAYYIGYGPSPLPTARDYGNSREHRSNRVSYCGNGLSFNELKPGSEASSTNLLSVGDSTVSGPTWLRFAFTFHKLDSGTNGWGSSLLNSLGFYQSVVWTDKIPVQKSKKSNQTIQSTPLRGATDG